MGVTNDRISAIRVVKYYGFGFISPGMLQDPDFTDIASYWDHDAEYTQDALGARIVSTTEKVIADNAYPFSFALNAVYRISYIIQDSTVISTIRFLVGSNTHTAIQIPVNAGETIGFVDVKVTSIPANDFNIYMKGNAILKQVLIAPLISQSGHPYATSMSNLFQNYYVGTRNMWNDATTDLSINVGQDCNNFFNYQYWIKYMNATNVFVKNINFDINDIIKMFQYASGITYQRRIEGVNIVFKKLSYTVEEKVTPTRAEFIIVPWT